VTGSSVRRIAAGRRGAARRPRAAEAGFTMVELMVALVVSSLLIGMILAIFLRISVAYRGQQQVAEVQAKLAAARARIEIDAKHAGLNLAQGFTLAATGSSLISPLRILNNTTAPDELGFYYADTSVQATALAACDRMVCGSLSSTQGFAVGDLVVETTSSATDGPFTAQLDARIAVFQACVLQVTAVAPGQLTFSQVAPWGGPGNTHCQGSTTPNGTVYMKFVPRYWRIDPGRPGEGVLQLSPTGNLVGVNDWQDQAYGFTDIQVATRFFEEGDLTDTLDPDLDPTRDWYSGEDQETRTAPGAGQTPLQVSISLVARTERDVEGIATAATPTLTSSANPSNNTLGDRAAVALPSSLPELSGNRIFRYTTFQVDLRNIGVGR
jgi:prepilin-type N-terminal cleavage/methylation domain-containing protein